VAGKIGAVPRRRLAVALLLPQPWATEIDGLRRASGDLQMARVAPHVTLIPPINVREADLPAVLGLLRASAADVPGPLDLGIGPTATFLPDSPVLYLRVGGPAVDDGRLVGIRAVLQTGPLDRPDRWPYVPHVTLAQDQPSERLMAGAAALADYVVELEIDRLHLLEEQSGPDGGRRWVPIADARFGPRVVVGRGSLPLELTTGSLVDPEARELLLPPPPDLEVDWRPDHQVVVTARRVETAEVVGVVVGDEHGTTPEVLAVARSAAGEGVEDHLLARWRWAAEPS
jgi:2'-5' RNA ligase